MCGESLAAEFRHVWKVYPCGLWSRRNIQALRGVTLTIPTGSIYGLVGPNRAGKTTLVKLLLSIAHPTRGTVRRLGAPASDRSTLAKIGYVHDSQAFPAYLTARSLLEYYGALSGLNRSARRQAIAARLDEVGLSDRASEPIAAFSKGMLQRLALAQALINNPDLLVLDEPGEGMDLLARKLLHEVLTRRKEQGRTAILVSHGLADIQRVCDHVAVIKYGEVAYAGKLEDLLGGKQRDRGDLEEILKPIYASTAL
jgi:ABC-2 type transport system ATP-binding protein